MLSRVGRRRRRRRRPGSNLRRPRSAALSASAPRAPLTPSAAVLLLFSPFGWSRRSLARSLACGSSRAASQSGLRLTSRAVRCDAEPLELFYLLISNGGRSSTLDDKRPGSCVGLRAPEY